MSFSHNRSSNAKRSNSILPDDIRKGFGGYVKKPKLDVRMTQLSPNSPNKLNHNTKVSHQEPISEDVWGEDLSEEAVEVCLYLASQACPEENPPKHVVDSSARKVAPGTSRAISDGFKVPSKVSKVSSSTKVFHKNIPKPFSARLNKQERSSFLKPTSFSNIQENNENESESSSIHETTNKKFEEEAKMLKEKLLSKEGEVSILRSQLKQLQLQLDTQTVDYHKSLEERAQKFKKQLDEQKKELDVTSTQLQMQIMEAATVRNHCKLLESNNKIKLIEPQASSPNYEKKKLDVFKKGQLNSSYGTSRSQASSNTGKHKVQTTDTIVSGIQINRSEVNIGIGHREGSVLGKSINEFIFQKSPPDISWILYIRKKQSLCKKIKEAKGINSKILALQKNTRTLERSYTAVNKLITLDSTWSTAAYPYIITVFQECHEILCRQLHILRLLFDVQSHTERIVLNGDIPTFIGTLAGDPSNHLMSARPWYEDEEGIESRRALGLLCALCNISYIAADLISGTSKLPDELCKGSNARTLTTSHQTGTLNNNVKGNHLVQNEVDESNVVSVNTSEGCGLEDKINYAEYYSKPYGFLHLLHDIVISISVQRTTRHFIGLLTGILKLLSSVARRSTLTTDGVAIVAEIIREIVFCCPQLEVVMALFELLAHLSSYSAVMKLLCRNSGDTTFVDKRHIGLTYFTRDTCPIQVLYWLLPNCTTSVSLRTKLCSHMVHWLYGMTCFLDEEKPWLLDLTGNIVKRKCSCWRNIRQGLVRVVFDSVCDLHEMSPIGDHMKWEVHEALGKVIILLKVWLQQDKEFWRNFGKDRFGCQLMLSQIQTEISKLDLDAMQVECINELLKGDNKEVYEESTVQSGDGDIDNYWNTMSSDCKILFLE